MTSSLQPTHLEPSQLGTKEYWDSLYTNELSNNTADPSDTGTVWFDDSDAEAKTLSFLSSLAFNTKVDPARAAVLDLGCGNGSLLFSLRDYGEDEDGDGDGDEDEDRDQRIGEKTAQRLFWTGRMLGIDYSPQSISLAQRILSTSEAEGKNRSSMAFREWDILSGPISAVLDGAQREGWDIVHDKGTFDAISLSGATDDNGRRACDGYRARALSLVKEGGYFIITSCNWTEPELLAWLAPAVGSRADDVGASEFVPDGRVEYRSFSFGGVKGQTVTTLCFRKKST